VTEHVRLRVEIGDREQHVRKGLWCDRIPAVKAPDLAVPVGPRLAIDLDEPRRPSLPRFARRGRCAAV